MLTEAQKDMERVVDLGVGSLLTSESSRLVRSGVECRQWYVPDHKYKTRRFSPVYLSPRNT